MKVAPDVTDEQIAELSRVFLDEGLDGLIATNTTLSRAGWKPARAVKKPAACPARR